MDVRDQDGLGVEVRYTQALPLDTPGANTPPFQPGRTVLAEGSVHREDALPLPCDIAVDRDTAVELRDGTVLYADIYRPVGEEPVPVILVWTPYGKSGGVWSVDLFPNRFGIPKDAVSGLQTFEAPDPAYWVNHGYAIAVVDVRGVVRSGGDMLWWGRAAGRDGYDVVEWLAEQDWCSGRVGTSGNSQLAIMQWFIAAEQPPHLAAIAPWEGMVDMYRENTIRGGIPDTAFQDNEIIARTYGQHRIEHPAEMITEYPLMNAYWADKRVALDRIEVPAYIVASFTNPLHTHGTFAAFREIASPGKWLRVHNSIEWPDYYQPDNVADLTRFFDHYLKGIDNGWQHTPPVRLSVLDPGGTDLVGRVEDSWPPARQESRTLHLDAADGTLSSDAVTHDGVARYTGDDPASYASFTLTFDHDTEITGYPTLRLWVEADGSDDMDLFVSLHKLDAEGNKLHHIAVPGDQAQAGIRAMARNGELPAMISYAGPDGRLRVSHRQLDQARSTPCEPYLSHTTEQLLTPGEIVPVDIAIWPTALRIHAGEQLRIQIAGHPLGGYALPGMPGGTDVPTRNKGAHLIHTGGAHDSRLLLPVIPDPS